MESPRQVPIRVAIAGSYDEKRLAQLCQRQRIIARRENTVLIEREIHLPNMSNLTKKSSSAACVSDTGSGKTIAYALPVLHRLKALETEGTPMSAGQITRNGSRWCSCVTVPPPPPTCMRLRLG